MRFISEARQSDGHPVVAALGVTRAKGGFDCEFVYVQPTPGESGDHVPLAAGIIPVTYWDSPDEPPVTTAIDWPGLTTGVPIGQRTHLNVFFTEEKHEQESTIGAEEAGS